MIDNSIQATIYYYITYYIPNEFKTVAQVVEFAKKLYLKPHGHAIRTLEKFDSACPCH